MSLKLRLEEIKKIPFGDLEEVIKELKGVILTLVHDAGSGHCGGSLSLIRPFLLYFREIHQTDRPAPHLSKGHCVPALYALGYRFGNISSEEMSFFRQVNGLSGHAEKRVQPLPSGILGQGGGIINGLALAEKLKGTYQKIYGFFGDGELDEPFIWSAIKEAGDQKLNVCYVIDYNKKNLSGPLHRNFENKIKAIKAFNLEVINASNTLESLIPGYLQAEKIECPVALIIDSLKGEGISFMENDPTGWHGSPLPNEQYLEGMKQLGLAPYSFRKEKTPSLPNPCLETTIQKLKAQGYGLASAPTRKANEDLVKLGEKENRLFVLIPDVGKSVNLETFAKKFPSRFKDVGIDEMEATLEALGLSISHFKPLVSTFDAFTYIPFSAIRIADYGQLPFLGFIFTHAEFIGEDGPTHLIAENLGAWNGLYNIKTLANPADLPQAKQALEYALNQGGLFYLRLGRPDVPILHNQNSLPPPGKADLLVKGENPVIITSGQEVWESLIAAEMLKEDGFNPTVVNVAYFRPFDAKTICQVSQDKLIFIPEAHKPEVGLASLVAYHLAVQGIPVKKIIPLGITSYVPSAPIIEQKKLFGLLGEQIYERIKKEMG